MFPNILVVDDSQTVRRLAVHVLECEGHNVKSACNGLEALELMKSNHYDIVLMDIHMPILDGFEATSQFRKYEKIKFMEISKTEDSLSDSVSDMSNSISWVSILSFANKQSEFHSRQYILCMISVEDDNTHRLRAVAAGMDGFLPKVFTPQQLYQAVIKIGELKLIWDQAQTVSAQQII